MRYIYDQQEEYLAGVAHIPGARAVVKSFTPYLRRWDRESAAGVDAFVANSRFCAQRVREHYGRDADVVHPPIDTAAFAPRPKLAGERGYLLAAGAFVSYKRFDLAIAAAERLGRRLVVAGSGPMEAQLRRLAGPRTSFEIAPDDARFRTLLAEAEALLFPGVEDFGMVAVEAMASGTPVIALRAGGALDFVVPGETGVFFDAPDVTALAGAIERFASGAAGRFDASSLAGYAAQYGRVAFKQQIERRVAALVARS
jgi:glycosyltransferase involved in cell wall biosynthesis